MKDSKYSGERKKDLEQSLEISEEECHDYIIKEQVTRLYGELSGIKMATEMALFDARPTSCVKAISK